MSGDSGLVASEADDDEIDAYTTGMCHIFAAALNRNLGWQLLVVVDQGEIYWENPADECDYIPSVVHVYALDEDGRAWDIKGVRSYSDIKDDVESWCHVQCFDTDFCNSEDDLRRYVGYWSDEGEPIDRPLESYTVQDIDEAWEVAERALANIPAFSRAREDCRSWAP